MALTLVPPAELTPKQAVIERIKKMPRPHGILQCPRCGCRTHITVRQNGYIKDGRIIPGAVVDRHICENCYVDGRLRISMLPPEIRPAK
jgi:hypothetical protein